MTTAETLTMTSATYLHTIPTGEEVTYEVSPSRWDDRCILVEYPADVDLSPYRSDDAYPMEQIQRDWGRFVRCDAYGTDGPESWEVWLVKR
jgi:hypothetical protein